MKKLTGVFTSEDGTKYKGTLEVDECRPWRADKHEYYYFIDTVGGVIRYCGDDRDDGDEYNYLTSNYFRTEAEAQAYKDYQLALGRVRHAIISANEGWKIDWKDDSQIKYQIYYSNYENKFIVYKVTSSQDVNGKYSYCRTKEIAEQIIKDHHNDLEIIRKYES